MPHPLEAGTIRILKSDGSTAGTGFLVSKRLAVTCAHVVQSTGVNAGQIVKFKYHLGELEIQKATVLENGWSTENDIAILELSEKPPKWIRPIIMQSSRAMEGRAFQGLGYPDDGPVQTRWPQGNISGSVDVDEYANPLLQLQGMEIDKGLSGSAVVDRTTRRVIGMITAYQDIKRPMNTESVRFGYAIPIETIWKIYPELEKELPPIPKRYPLVEGIHLLPHGYDFRIQNFLTEYLGMPKQPEPFGGREDVLRQLDEWLDGDTQRLLLAAPAGRGKSALLVRWLDHLLYRDDLAIVFVPVSVRFRTNLSSAFFASLGARLAYLHGEEVPTNELTLAEDWHRLASASLTKPLLDGRQLLVVIDGLDEAGDWEASTDLIPAELPKNVRVVVSARYLAGEKDERPWLARLGWEHSGTTSTINLEPLDSAGIQDVLVRMGLPLEKLSQRLDVVYEIHYLSRGDPLLVNLYVDDLWSRGENVSRLQPTDLKDIKPGYEGYFDRWWADQQKLWGNEKPLREKSVYMVFNLLCGALGGLTKDDLSTLATNYELDSYTIDDALDALKRFVIGIPDDRIENRISYVLSHPKLQDYFWKRLTKTEQNELETRFLLWGEQSLHRMVDGMIDPKNKEEIPSYIIQHYGIHLDRAKQPIEKRLPLIYYQQWAKAWFTIEGAYGGYLQDVRRVWNECKLFDGLRVKDSKNPLYLYAQVRCAMIESSLHSLSGNIPPELIPSLMRFDLWTLPQVWVAIRQMPNSADQSKAVISILTELADHQLPDALQFIRTISNERDKVNVLKELVNRLPEDQLHQALTTAYEIRDYDLRVDALMAFMPYMPNVADELLDTVLKIEDTNRRSSILAKLVRVLYESKLDRLLEIARDIRDDWEARAEVLIMIARYVPKITGEAVDATRMIDRKWGRILAFRNLALQSPEFAKEAFDAAQTLDEYLDRADAFVKLVRFLPQSIDQVFETVLQADNEADRAYILSSLSQVLPENEIGRFIATARKIKNSAYRADVFIDAAKKFPGLAEDALEEVRLIGNEMDRAFTLYRFAESPIPILDKILEETLKLKETSARLHVLNQLIKFLPEAVDIAIEEFWTLSRESPIWGPQLEPLATYLPKEKIYRIVELVRMIKDSRDRAWIFNIISGKIPELVIDALSSTEKINDEEEYVSLLCSLAIYLPHLSSMALDAAGKLDNGSSCRIPLQYLAKLRPEVSLQALNLLETINDKWGFHEWLAIIMKRNPRIAQEVTDVISRGSQEEILPRLTELARRLPDTELEPVDEVIKKIDIQEVKRIRLSSILHGQGKIEDLDQILLEIRNLSDKRSLTALLCALVQCLPEKELDRILAITRLIDDDWAKARILSELTRRLPRLSGEAIQAASVVEEPWKMKSILCYLAGFLSDEGQSQVLSVAKAILSEEYRADVIAPLAQRLPKTKLYEVSAEAARIDNQKDRARVLRVLVDRLLELPAVESYSLLETLILELSNRTRPNFYSDISVLLPIIVSIGAANTPRDIYESASDITTWWS
jgi:V8-like Glu-specific endopeptidase